MITKEDIDYIAELAQLSFSEAEKEELLPKLNRIIADSDKLNVIDTGEVQPLEHISNLQNVLRQDIVTQSFEREILLRCASQRENGYYIVPKIVE